MRLGLTQTALLAILCTMAKHLPAKPKRPDRSDRICVRLTPEERQVIEAAATKDGLGSSSWLRQLGLRTGTAR
jgi:hypothetical protein